MNSSFYGGPRGDSFYIKAVFTTKNGATDSLAKDLSLGWNSPIGESEIVVISYGLPSDPSYLIYKEIDTNAEQKSFNSTMWEKCYDESLRVPAYVPPDDSGIITNQNGWCYKLIASMTGNTPRIQAGTVIELPPGKPPQLDINGDPDSPILVFSLPGSQVLSVEQPPTIVGPLDDPLIEHKYRKNEDGTDDLWHPVLKFYIPRATKFYYGDMLGQQKIYEDVNDASFEGYKAGDYYINKSTGFVYLITKAEDNTCTFEFTASIQQPLPEVSAVGISPYTDDKELNTPTVRRDYKDEEKTKWWLEYGLPRAPKFDVEAKYIGSVDKGSATSEIKDKDTVALKFNIPTGTRLFAGTLVGSGTFDAEVPGAREEDVYLNSSTGVMYVLRGGVWVLADENGGTLKGPPGEPFHHVGGDYRIEVDNVNKITLQGGVDFIKQNYTEPFSNKDTFTITWQVTTGDGSEPIEQSYFYYCTDVENDTWNWSLITGKFSNIVKNEHHDGSAEDTVDITSTTYSIEYINSLIGIGLGDVAHLDRRTYSSDQIMAMLSWGTWDDAISGTTPPVPDYYKTLSADEIIYLMSWGRFGGLIDEGGEYA